MCAGEGQVSVVCKPCRQALQLLFDQQRHQGGRVRGHGRRYCPRLLLLQQLLLLVLLLLLRRRQRCLLICIYSATPKARKQATLLLRACLLLLLPNDSRWRRGGQRRQCCSCCFVLCVRRLVQRSLLLVLLLQPQVGVAQPRQVQRVRPCTPRLLRLAGALLKAGQHCRAERALCRVWAAQRHKARRGHNKRRTIKLIQPRALRVGPMKAPGAGGVPLKPQAGASAWFECVRGSMHVCQQHVAQHADRSPLTAMRFTTLPPPAVALGPHLAGRGTAAAAAADSRLHSARSRSCGTPT